MEIAVPVKSTNEMGFSEIARQAIREAMEEMQLKPRGLFELLYGRLPEGNEEQTLRNRLNRGNPGADFIGLCVSKMPPLQNQPMSEFFNIKKPEQQ